MEQKIVAVNCFSDFDVPGTLRSVTNRGIVVWMCLRHNYS